MLSCSASTVKPSATAEVDAVWMVEVVDPVDLLPNTGILALANHLLGLVGPSLAIATAPLLESRKMMAKVAL